MLQNPNGFPHPTRLDQTSLLTSVATGYYFTELTNFRWGAVIKWSGMETCSCVLVPQVFTSPKHQLKTLQELESSIWKLVTRSRWRCSSLKEAMTAHASLRKETPLTPWILPRSQSCPPDIPVVIKKEGISRLCLFGFEYVAWLSGLSMSSLFNGSWKYPRYNAYLWFLWWKSVVCSKRSRDLQTFNYK